MYSKMLCLAAADLHPSPFQILLCSSPETSSSKYCICGSVSLHETIFQTSVQISHISFLSVTHQLHSSFFSTIHHVSFVTKTGYQTDPVLSVLHPFLVLYLFGMISKSLFKKLGCVFLWIYSQFHVFLGRPTPIVEWRKKDGTLKDMSGRLKNHNRWLYFDNISQEDDGEYECRASNSLGFATHTFTVTVEGKQTLDKK